MRSLKISALAFTLFGASCSIPNISEIPVQFQFDSERYYGDLLKCQGIVDLIESRKLRTMYYNKEAPAGKTLINSGGNEKLILTLKRGGTSVVFKSAQKLPARVVNAAKACGN